ncbi:MAG TPA: zinc ribbon domain-containing protein [Candidatus Kapabacteria bacterium]|nr:zinc ribbon domain-containing protein [Ignavibacteria bacterium]HRK60011.1 zinc ribbon domain-containing protein [Candidatus Kapabacteria bacterium]
MPTYDYQCSTCGAVFEYFQPMSAQPLEKCPEMQCAGKVKGQGNVTRKIGGGAGLIFNGSGFYLTDYVKKGSGSPTSAPAPAPAASAESV